jgi:hypothetical protein
MYKRETTAARTVDSSLPSLVHLLCSARQTLTPASFGLTDTSIPELLRASLKLRHGFLLLHVKPIEAGSSQSTLMSLACRSPAVIDLLLLTISGLADELYSSVVSS